MVLFSAPTHIYFSITRYTPHSHTLSPTLITTLHLTSQGYDLRVFLCVWFAYYVYMICILESISKWLGSDGRTDGPVMPARTSGKGRGTATKHAKRVKLEHRCTYKGNGWNIFGAWICQIFLPHFFWSCWMTGYSWQVVVNLTFRIDSVCS